MRRWYERLLNVANDWDSHSFDEQIDFALVFFHNAYHLRDYLLKENAVAQRPLDDLMHESPSLRISRDLANGSKHREISRPSVDASPWIVRTLNFGPQQRLTLKAGPDLLDLVNVAGGCVEAWDAFMLQHCLDPWSLSRPAQQLSVAIRGRERGYYWSQKTPGVADLRLGSRQTP